MRDKWRLFSQRNPYAVDPADRLFLEAVKENLALHRANCPEYAAILSARGFDASQLVTEADLYKIPPLPTLYFKRNTLFSVDDKALALRASSSGTRGLQSRVGFDRETLRCGYMMMFRFFSYHHVVSPVPVNYIVLGYEPSGHSDAGAMQSAFGTTRFAPALHREYALKDTGAEYVPNIEGLRTALLRYAKQGFPVRFVGFPAYMYFLAAALREKGIALRLHPQSKILLGGGWKQFAQAQIDREEFFRLIRGTLGLEKQSCLEFYSAVEHPLPYCKCKNGHFHVPVYSRAIIRDVDTLLPIPLGEAGLLSFVSPLVTSMPLVSVVTDDLATLQDGAQCGCGIVTPYFTLLGRAGVRQIKTCAADAAELLGVAHA